MNASLPGLDPPEERVEFIPTRTAALARLERFVARAGRYYASKRNHDLGPARRNNVSVLSPWIRHRIITEEEILASVLARHSPESAEKFVQEVFWRTYFKGWLEQRPSVWSSYQRGVIAAFDALESDRGPGTAYAQAVSGRTGIGCFDHWAQELVATGYLHNHARMWFASIWIFTLNLPWQLGADFFLGHLVDGDPASNTLGWRWVAGLHTKGKTYLARADNIARYTDGRFDPAGLASVARPLVETEDHPRVPIARSDPPVDGPYLLLLSEEDMSGASLMPHEPEAAIGLLATQGRSPRPVGLLARRFAKEGLRAALAPFGVEPVVAQDWVEPIIQAACRAGVRTVMTACAPVGPVRARLDRAEPALRDAGVDLVRITRAYDSACWPHAKAGFFGLKRQIPRILRDIDLTG